jgi:hypothetical protein
MRQNRSCIGFIEEMDDAIGKHLLGALEDVNDRRIRITFGTSSFSRIKVFRDFSVSVLR